MCCSLGTWVKGEAMRSLATGYGLQATGRMVWVLVVVGLGACAGELVGGAGDGAVVDGAGDGASADLHVLEKGAAPDMVGGADIKVKPDKASPMPDQKQPKPDKASPKPDSKPPAPPPLDLKKVKWLHTDVSGWPVKAKLSSVTFSGGNICLNYDKANTWSKNQISGVDVNANPWVFIYQSGLWYGATWEWMRPGQTCKSRTSVAGDHIKQKPFDAVSGWVPKKGQVLYFMVSGLARMGSSITNVQERTAPVKVIWP